MPKFRMEFIRSKYERAHRIVTADDLRDAMIEGELLAEEPSCLDSLDWDDSFGTEVRVRGVVEVID